jgi:hypothetical protein
MNNQPIFLNVNTTRHFCPTIAARTKWATADV